MINIRHFIGHIKRCILKWHTDRSWVVDARKMRALIKPQEYFSIKKSARVLILAPHSDDEWIGCSHIIINCPNTTICSMEMEGGDDISKHLERINEMRNVANFFSRELLTISSDKQQSLISIIKKLSPEYICVPSIYDWHPEHIQVIDYLKEAILQLEYKGKVLSYQVSVPMPISLCHVAFPMSFEEQKYKWDIFSEYYKTQAFMPVLRFKKQEEINGAICEAFSAEVYSCFDALDWVRYVSSANLGHDEIVLIKSKLNNISAIRTIVENIFKMKKIN